MCVELGQPQRHQRSGAARQFGAATPPAVGDTRPARTSSASASPSLVSFLEKPATRWLRLRLHSTGRRCSLQLGSAGARPGSESCGGGGGIAAAAKSAPKAPAPGAGPTRLQGLAEIYSRLVEQALGLLERLLRLRQPRVRGTVGLAARDGWSGNPRHLQHSPKRPSRGQGFGPSRRAVGGGLQAPPSALRESGERSKGVARRDRPPGRQPCHRPSSPLMQGALHPRHRAHRPH